MHQNKYRVLVGQHTYDLDIEDCLTMNMIALDEDKYHLIDATRGYSIDIVSMAIDQKRLELRINGKLMNILIQDPLDLIIQSMGYLNEENQVSQNVHAPMPGLVLEILTQEGQFLEKGHPILILEAMKMENLIKMPGPGKIHRIEIAKGETVDKGQLLIEIE